MAMACVPVGIAREGMALTMQGNIFLPPECRFPPKSHLGCDSVRAQTF